MIRGHYMARIIHSIAGNSGFIAMTHAYHRVFLSLAALLLTACASTPKFDLTGVDVSITPSRALAENAALQGSVVLWGGMIIASSNLKNVTQFEILAYPLGSNQKPDLDKPPMGRFLAEQAGYLETSDYAQGRLITVSGALQSSRQGRVGESDYSYPVLDITQHYLWPLSGESATRIHFNIGVMFHN